MMISHTLAALYAASPELLAQAPSGMPASPMSNPIFMIVPMVLLMYFLIIRPQRKRQKELDALVASVTKGDRVLTTGGIHGSVAEVKERTLAVTIASNVTVEMEKTSIAAVINPKKQETAVVATAAKAKA